MRNSRSRVVPTVEIDVVEYREGTLLNEERRNAGESEVAIEEIELAVEGLEIEQA